MSRKARKNVGVIGLGIIGTRVAAGLRAAGYQAYVWNRSAKPAPNFLGSPEEVAEAAEIIQLFVSDSAALFEVIEAMGDALTAKHIVVCSATVGPEAVLEAAQIVEAKGAQFLDAPFTGSKLAAEKRQLVYYIGGSEATFLRARPVLEATSKAIVRIGEVGHAATVKVVTNMISAVSTQVLAEALSIVQKAGLEPEVLAAAIEQNACRSGVMDLKLPKMITGDYDPHFSLKHMFKDVQLGIHMANALDIEVPATTVTAGVMYGAINKGWADLDFSALFKNYAPIERPDTLPALRDAALLEDESDADQTVDEPEKKADMSAKDRSAEPNDSEEIESATGRNAATSQEPAADLDKSLKAEEENAPASKGGRFEALSQPAEGELSNADAFPEDVLSKEGKREGKTAPGVAESDGETPKNEGEPAAEGEEPPARSGSFVRRWFVARSGS